MRGIITEAIFLAWEEQTTLGMSDHGAKWKDEETIFLNKTCILEIQLISILILKPLDYIMRSYKEFTLQKIII